jgi:predicted ATPase
VLTSWSSAAAGFFCFASIPLTRPWTCGAIRKAAGYWLRAGKIAVAHYANIEVIAHLRRGIEAVGGLRDGAINERLELDLSTTNQLIGLNNLV